MPDASPGSGVPAPEQLVHPELELSCLPEPATASPAAAGRTAQSILCAAGITDSVCANPSPRRKRATRSVWPRGRRADPAALGGQDPGTPARQERPSREGGRPVLTSTLKYCSAPQTAAHKIQSKVCKKTAPEGCRTSSRLPAPRARRIIVDRAPGTRELPARPLSLRFLSEVPVGRVRRSSAAAGLGRARQPGPRRQVSGGPRSPSPPSARPGPAPRPARACPACARPRRLRLGSCGRAAAARVPRNVHPSA